jgi:hypothetical protein
MRTRIGLFLAPLLLLVGLLLPATVAASNVGTVKIISYSCTGYGPSGLDTINADFLDIKWEHHYVNGMRLTVTDQWSNGGAWHNGSSQTWGIWPLGDTPKGRATADETVTYTSVHSLMRIKATARFYVHGSVIYTTSITTPVCG